MLLEEKELVVMITGSYGFDGEVHLTRVEFYRRC